MSISRATLHDNDTDQMKHPNLTKRGKYWHVSKQINGVRYRTSTKTGDYKQALSYLHKKVLGLTKPAKPLYQQSVQYLEWDKEVALARQGDGGHLNTLYNGAKSRAKRKGIKFYLTYDDLIAIAVRSEGLCEVTAIPFSFDVPRGNRSAPYKPSLDRIDSSKGYSRRNCRLIAWAVNLGMGEWDDTVFHNVACAYAAKSLLVTIV